MKLNTQGFSAIEGLLILVIIGIIGFAGWKVWDARTNPTETSNSTPVVAEPQAETYERTTTVPTDWRTYESKEYKFSLSYPANWTVRAEDNDGELSGSIYPDKTVNPQGNPQYSFSTRGGSLDEAIAERKQIVSNNQSADDSVKLTITSEKAYNIDGHRAIRLDMTSDDGTTPDSYSTEFYISANGRLYVFDTGFHEQNAMKDEVLTIFESMKIN